MKRLAVIVVEANDTDLPDRRFDLLVDTVSRDLRLSGLPHRHAATRDVAVARLVDVDVEDVLGVLADDRFVPRG